MKGHEVRQRFLDFFSKKGHTIVSSAPLVPKLDPTLLFANAGMNQFKGVFVGEEKRDYVRAASTQKCVRAGGKHNDLENVGQTSRHQTFFEMLGNFSFGDYFKKEAISYAWEFVTKDLGLPQDRLYVSVFREDDEAAGIWKNEIGLDEKRIYRFNEKDNFWSMGETGPCGPCSEIFFDQGKEAGCGKPTCDVGCECDRYLEFWNLVFMEFEQKSDGTREKLPKPSIDTGMGLERITAIVQGVTSNYDTDLFQPLLQNIGQHVGLTYAKASDAQKMSMRVIADHLRSMTFLITDGVHPSNEGRGYVLRRIMRRAMRHGRKLGVEKPFLHLLVPQVVNQMGQFFEELTSHASSTQKVVEEEEKRFALTIDRGLTLLEEEIGQMKHSKQKVLDGRVAFRLYDTYGFPVDLTADVLREEGFTVDQEGFDEAFSLHREKARGSWKGSSQNEVDQLVPKWVEEGVRTEFVGYEHLSADGKVLKLVQEGKEVQTAQAGDEVELVADTTSFYGESGGQVGDIGGVAGSNFSLEVVDTRKPSPEIFLHQCVVTEGTVSVGDEAVFRVDEKARRATMKNHTATHLLHAILREVLGEEVKQAGSLVSPERLRFDFSFSRAVTKEELLEVERRLNERVWRDDAVQKEVMAFDDAMETGAMALFDEKYGSKVRVVTIADHSKELCGGTHLSRTGDIGIFKLLKESSVAAGVRRIEAVTGRRALRLVQETDSQVKDLASRLGGKIEELPDRIEKLLQKQKDLEKALRKKGSAGTQVVKEGDVETLGGMKCIVTEVEASDPRELRDLADRHLEKLKEGVVVIGSKNEAKAFLAAKVSKSLSKKVHAGKVVQIGAKVLGGSGGGRPDMAQAGGPQIEKLADALLAVKEHLASG